MDEQTTTSTPVEAGGQVINGVAVDDQGLAIPEPEQTEEVPAVEQTTEVVEETTPETKAEPTAEPSEDDKLAEWAEKKGLKLDSENATKAAKMAREAERAMHQKAQRASELEKTIDNSITEEAEAQGLTNDDRVEIARIKTQLGVRDFWDSHPEAREYEKAMVDELQKRPYLAGDLEALYAVVRTSNLDDVKTQAKRDTLESLAHKQTATVPRGNAVNGASMETATITPQNVDQLVAKNDLDWFIKNQAAINKAMAG